MGEGILKSDSDAIWNYIVSLNKCIEYISEAEKNAIDDLESLEYRLNQKRLSIVNKQAELEREIHFYSNEKEHEKDEKKQIELQEKINETKLRIKNMAAQDEELLYIIKTIPLYTERLVQAKRKYVSSVSKAKRILNAYLKMVEEYNISTSMKEYGYGGVPGKYGVMEFRNTTFYCDGCTYAPTSDNIKLMEQGKAPIGYDGQPVELHHLIQSEKGGIMEVSGSMHKKNHKTLHINTSDIPSGINRSSFQMLRCAYWKRRARILKEGMGG